MAFYVGSKKVISKQMFMDASGNTNNDGSNVTACVYPGETFGGCGGIMATNPGGCSGSVVLEHSGGCDLPAGGGLDKYPFFCEHVGKKGPTQDPGYTGNQNWGTGNLDCQSHWHFCDQCMPPRQCQADGSRCLSHVIFGFGQSEYRSGMLGINGHWGEGGAGLNATHSAGSLRTSMVYTEGAHNGTNYCYPHGDEFIWDMERCCERAFIGVTGWNSGSVVCTQRTNQVAHNLFEGNNTLGYGRNWHTASLDGTVGNGGYLEVNHQPGNNASGVGIRYHCTCFSDWFCTDGTGKNKLWGCTNWAAGPGRFSGDGQVSTGEYPAGCWIFPHYFTWSGEPICKRGFMIGMGWEADFASCDPGSDRRGKVLNSIMLRCENNMGFMDGCAIDYWSGEYCCSGGCNGTINGHARHAGGYGEGSALSFVTAKQGITCVCFS